MMIGARTAAWAKAGGGGIPYVQLNPENTEFRVGFAPDIVDGVEYSVDLFVGQTQTLPSRQCAIWIQGTGGISFYLIIETSAKISGVFVADGIVHRASVVFSGMTADLKVDGNIVSSRTYQEGAKITTFGIGGYSKLLPAYSTMLLGGEISVGGDVINKFVPVLDNGEGKFKSIVDGTLYRTNKNADSYPPKFGYLDVAAG